MNQVRLIKLHQGKNWGYYNSWDVQVVPWLEAWNEKLASRVQIPAEFIKFTFTQRSFGKFWIHLISHPKETLNSKLRQST